MSIARQRLMHAISEGIVQEAEAIAREIGNVNVEDVIGAWLADMLHHDMRDSTIRWLHNRKKDKPRVGLGLPDDHDG